MGYKFIPHTADVRLKVQGKSLQELFCFAMQGLAETIKHGSCSGNTSVKKEIKIKSLDTTSLLVDFLSDVLTAGHTNKCVYTEIEFLEITPTTLYAIIRGFRVDKFDEDVKAVTYHEASVHKNAAGEFEATIVFDI